MPIAQIREISFFEISSQLILPYTLQCMWQLSFIYTYFLKSRYMNKYIYTYYYFVWAYLK